MYVHCACCDCGHCNKSVSPDVAPASVDLTTLHMFYHALRYQILCSISQQSCSSKSTPHAQAPGMQNSECRLDLKMTLHNGSLFCYSCYYNVGLPR